MCEFKSMVEYGMACTAMFLMCLFFAIGATAGMTRFSNWVLTRPWTQEEKRKAQCATCPGGCKQQVTTIKPIEKETDNGI